MFWKRGEERNILYVDTSDGDGRTRKMRKRKDTGKKTAVMRKKKMRQVENSDGGDMGGKERGKPKQR